MANKWITVAALLVLAAACGDDDSMSSPNKGDGGGHHKPGAKDAGDGGGNNGDGSVDHAKDGGGNNGGDGGSNHGDASMSAGGSGGSTAPMQIVDHPPKGCEDNVAGQLPMTLSCTGLYEDIAKKKVAAGLHEYAPAHQLWSDGATKQRWIYLPDGTKIDTSAADQWKFPVGTKFFKEFSWDGHRVETRVFWKSTETVWLKTAYHWNDDETEATRFAGGEVDVSGHTYYIPSAKECDECHKGRTDRALGFELLLLGLPGATGMTLQQLISDKLLTQDPKQTDFEIGDDGTGKAAPALAWLHVNCGISCHNSNSAAEGYTSDLRLRLPYDAIDGSSSADFDARKTTIGVIAHTPKWMDKTRIVAGSPDDSLLYQLASTRDMNMPKNHMPPIATRVVDADGMKLVEAWIKAMPAQK